MRRTTKQTTPPSPASPVAFEPADYWQLRCVCRDVEIVIAQAQAETAKALSARATLLAALSDKYGFAVDSIATIQWNDETHEMRFGGGGTS